MFKIYGVFGSQEQIYNKLKQIHDSIPPSSISKFIISHNLNLSLLEVKNGDVYLGVAPSHYARPYRWYQVFLPHDFDLNILNDVINPNIVSDLPEHLRIVGYWC